MYVEFSHRSKLLQDTVQAIPELQLRIRNLATGPETPLQFTCTVSGCEADRFEAVVAEDPTVARIKRLDCRKRHQPYWIEAVPGTPQQRAYEAAIDAGGVYVRTRRVPDKWCTSMNFPDQQAFEEFRDRLNEAGMEVNPTVVRAGQYRLSAGATELTEKQEAVLTAALDCGYFEIPREGSLDQIATALGISRQAASERLRRAMGSLASGVVDTDSGSVG